MSRRRKTRYGPHTAFPGQYGWNLLQYPSFCSQALVIGLLVNSVSVMADAFNNLSDAASSIIGFISVKDGGKSLRMMTIPSAMECIGISPLLYRGTSCDPGGIFTCFKSSVGRSLILRTWRLNGFLSLSCSLSIWGEILAVGMLTVSWESGSTPR